METIKTLLLVYLTSKSSWLAKSSVWYWVWCVSCLLVFKVTDVISFPFATHWFTKTRRLLRGFYQSMLWLALSFRWFWFFDSYFKTALTITSKYLFKILKFPAIPLGPSSERYTSSSFPSSQTIRHYPSNKRTQKQ